MLRMHDEDPGYHRPKSGEWNRCEEDTGEHVVAVLDWHEFSECILEGELSSGRQACKNACANKLIDTRRRAADDTSDSCQQRSSDEEIAATKDIRETANEGVSNC